MHCIRQVIMVRENISIQRRNDALRAQTRYQGLLDGQIPLVPEEMKPFQRKYICTHGWPERERSKGTRKVRKLRRTECPYQFLAQVVQTKQGWGRCTTTITLRSTWLSRNSSGFVAVSLDVWHRVARGVRCWKCEHLRLH